MNFLKLFAGMVLVILMVGCKVFRCQTQMEENTAWTNPQIHCHVPEVADEVFIEKGRSELKGEEGVMDFCARMREHFAQSHMSPEEARKVYDMLLESGMLQDESFGMPSPDDPPARITDYSTRAAIKKTGEDRYELFIIITGGGLTYYHLAFEWPESPSQLQLEPLEVWRASYPW